MKLDAALRQVNAALARKRRHEAASVPRLFTDFIAWLGLSFAPGVQYVLCRCAFDGVDPVDLPDEQRALARTVFGDVDRFTPIQRRTVAAACGGRGGKTYVIESLRLLHLALTVGLTTLAPGEEADAPIIAPDKSLAKQALNYVKGAIRSHPALLALVRGDITPASETVTIVRPDGAVVTFTIRAASAKGTATRGRTLVGAVLDEAAFFLDDNYQVNDEQIYAALLPRIVPDGQAIVGSTPFAAAGLLFKLIAENHPDPSVAGIATRAERKGTAIAAWATTIMLRDTPEVRAMVAAEYERDPENAAREYGAQFVSAGTAVFFDEVTLAACIDYASPFPREPVPGTVNAAAADFGFERDNAACAITHREGRICHAAALLELKPEKGVPLKPSEVTKQFGGTAAAHGCSYLMADGHYRASVIEHMPDGVGFVDAPARDEVYVTVKARMREGLVRIANHPRLLQQLRAVMARPKPGGGVTIVLPRGRAIGHCDLVSAWVLAVYQSVGGEVHAPPPKQGTAEWEAEQKAIRRREHQSEQARSRQYWRRRA